MPITLPPITRRCFLRAGLGASLAATAAFTAPNLQAESATFDKNVWALLADIHLFADPKGQWRMSEDKPIISLDTFRQARTDILSGAAGRPHGVLVLGDCAGSQGTPGDYKTLLAESQPFREAGLFVHFLLGNHDNRKNFLEAVAVSEGKNPPPTIPDRCHSIVETPAANLFLLDSLQQVNNAPGLLGTEQIDWIAAELDARKDKPAVLFANHYPDFLREASRFQNPLVDTALFFDRLTQRKQAKAYFFGHAHVWHHSRHKDIHAVNIPTTVWRADLKEPRGWVLMTLKENGVALKLRSLDPDHPKHDETVELAWR